MVSRMLSLVVAFAFFSVVMANEMGTKTDLTLKAGGQTKFSLGGKEFTVRFVEVVEDSRCPKGVDCVWAGMARVRLELSVNRGETQEVVLDTLAETDTAEFGDSSIRLKSLDPYPEAGAQIDPKTYVATLEVTPRKGS